MTVNKKYIRDVNDQKLDKKTWAHAISQPAKEFPLSQLTIISGKIPQGLRGTLYRNGPGRLQRGNMSVGHWFDGDGAILAVHFRDEGARAVYRYVQTRGYQEETQADKFLYGNYGMTAPGMIWHKWQRPVKNAANTSVLALPDQLLALWEGDHPHALDLENLETKGLTSLGGLTEGKAYSAHPKVDYQTGEIFNFGVNIGTNFPIGSPGSGVLNVYKSDFTGRIIQHSQFDLTQFSLIHDFVLAGKYLVFFVPPVQLNIWSVLLGISSYSQALTWQPHIGTQIIVIDRENLSLVSRGETESWFQWHFSNGYVDSRGMVIIDFAKYTDFQTNEYLQEVATGKVKTTAKTTFTRVELNPQTGRVKQLVTLLNRTCEFPSVPSKNVGKFSPATYMSIFKEGTETQGEILNSMAKFDHENGSLTEANLGLNCYPSEPIYVEDRTNSDRGWVLTVVYDGNSHSSKICIFDSHGMNEEPICQLALPSVIPHSFHGTWKPYK